jgi:site-specific DNA-methyltransferase (adenine-specific)
MSQPTSTSSSAPYVIGPVELIVVLYRESWKRMSGESDIPAPFPGSGTTLVAAALAGRKAVGIEIEERYCELARARLIKT